VTDDLLASLAPHTSIVGRDLNCLSAPTHHFVAMTFKSVNLAYAHLEQSNFEDCHFTDVTFVKAEMNRCEITDCTFTNCNFFRVDMISAKIKRARFDHCNFSDMTLCDGLFESVEFIACLTGGGGIGDNEEHEVSWLSA
jgi:uncharacterized protein YjbI with pentapeptide repeats